MFLLLGESLRLYLEICATTPTCHQVLMLHQGESADCYGGFFVVYSTPAFADVRNVADAHYQAIERGARGRFVICNGVSFFFPFPLETTSSLFISLVRRSRSRTLLLID